ncbi:alpha/beta-hydrolase [Daldinia caldariorum]|uniref:alpha/beta-hydrolase n=1 Tax=Daldinia caldariorum TaxID=326644 RepID=UPI0020075D89|nr:alpha/beta-hydrolase [Daldinia caldariorum]KAI1470613.1 alpha/beta-hydrolase [Daldinia caldariorum]
MASKSLSALLLTSLAAVASARNCKNLTVPLFLSAQNSDFDFKVPSSDIEVTNYVLNFGRTGVSFADEILSENKYRNVTGNYSIAATYCEPDSGPGRALQILIRKYLTYPLSFSQQQLPNGAAFDRNYWHFPAHSYNYSYADAALARNYSVFFYDRPGIGQSSRGDPVNEIQSRLEVAALRELTLRLRRGSLPGLPARRHPKIVHVGHSYGSAQTYALTAAHPSLPSHAAGGSSEDRISDAIALTGFSMGLGTFVNNFLFGGNFVLAKDTDGDKDRESYGPGYIASGDVSAVQSNFFAPDNFDPAILREAYERGAPVAVGELLTIADLTAVNNSYAGPVFVITGENDIAFCGGNCYATNPSIPAQVASFFPNNTLVESYVVAGSGHGLNLEYTAPDTYARILDFFDKSV